MIGTVISSIVVLLNDCMIDVLLVNMGFPKIRGTILGFPIIRTRIYWGLYWGPPILGNYHMGLRRLDRKLAKPLLALQALSMDQGATRFRV